MTKPPKDFLGKAQKLVRWNSALLADMIEAGSCGDLDKVEMHFFSLLTQIDSLHDAIAGYAKIMKRVDWRSELDGLRSADPLLRYIWLARNSEHHDALLKWNKQAFEFNYRVVDMEKFNRVVRGYRVHSAYMTENERHIGLLQYLFAIPAGKPLAIQKPPTPERIESAGVVLDGFANTLSLQAFDSRDHGRVERPTSHLGKPLTAMAVKCSEVTIQFYAKKLNEIRALTAT